MPAMTQPPYQPPVAPGQPYPPQQYGPPVSPPPYQPYHPPQKSFWKTTKGQLAIIGMVAGPIVLVSALVIIAAISGSTASGGGVDVTATSCTFSGSTTLPSATVGLTATNNGNRTRSVRVDIEYRDSSGARIDTDTAYIRDVAPGDTVRTEETTLLDAAPVGSGRCIIVDIR